MRGLIVNADDFGCSPRVSQAILRSHDEGIVTSTTVMVTTPYTKDYWSSLQKRVNLEVGLHIVVASSEPMKPCLPAKEIPTLVDAQGLFRPHSTFLDWVDEINLIELRRELEAQLASFEEGMGRAPSHFDVHCHLLYLNPRLFSEVVVPFAVESNFPMRYPYRRGGRFVDELRIPVDQNVINRLASQVDKVFQNAGIRTPDTFNANMFGKKGNTLLRLLETIYTLPEGVTEIMTHPGYAQDKLLTQKYKADREYELEALVSPEPRALIQQQGIEMMQWSSI